MAGIINFYDRQNFYYLRVSHNNELGKCIGVVSAQNNIFNQPGSDKSIEGWDKVFLKSVLDYDELQFFYSCDEINWIQAGPKLDASTLSDEFCYEGRFTGAFIGLCCQDLSGKSLHADFDWFDYQESS